jgi:hypothetical protein
MPSSPATNDVLIFRPAGPADAAALEHLAALDSSRPLRGPVVVALRDGVLLAALETATGRTIADPFHPTADLVALLRVHATDRMGRRLTRAPRGTLRASLRVAPARG